MPSRRGCGRVDWRAGCRGPRERVAVRPLLAILGLAGLATAVPAPAATLDAEVATLDAADARVSFTAPAACRVEIAFTVATSAAAAVEHRLLLEDGGRAEEVSVRGALASAGAPERRGAATLLGVRLPGRGRHAYTLAYRVVRHPSARFRCPLWFPNAPAQGTGGRVRLAVSLPPLAVPLGDTFPRLAWNGGTGSIALAHMPAFVRVPFASPGEPRPGPLAGLGVDRSMEIAAVGLLVAATAVWLRRRGRR